MLLTLQLIENSKNFNSGACIDTNICHICNKHVKFEEFDQPLAKACKALDIKNHAGNKNQKI